MVIVGGSGGGILISHLCVFSNFSLVNIYYFCKSKKTINLLKVNRRYLLILITGCYAKREKIHYLSFSLGNGRKQYMGSPLEASG